MPAIYHSDSFTIERDGVQWKEHEAVIISPNEIHSTYHGNDSIPWNLHEKKYIWRKEKNTGHYPQYTSDIPLVDALYNMALDELEKNRTPDGKLWDTGARWGGVWTRDISYSVLLSLAFIAPEISMNCLRAKVKDGVILQDTGTGGSWPVSSDRVSWILAAWEIFLVTGDRQWLEEIYPVFENAIQKDGHTLYYPESLALGESSFLDWREQTYPRWMKPVNIFRSENLGTNCVHFQACSIAARAAEILHLPFEQYRKKAQYLQEKINEQLWIPERGYYGQYRYGFHYLSLSPRSEALGEAFTILFDIADRKRQNEIMERTPVGEYGIPSIYPQVPGIPPYHNDGVWPFVQSFWNLAAVKTGNQRAVEHGLAALYRAAALFLTHKENFVAGSGDSQGTVINSDRQLWSIAGNIAMVYRVFAGMHFQPGRLVFQPFIPPNYGDSHSIINFNYRDMCLNVTISGCGSKIRSFSVNGKKQENWIPAEKKGNYHIEIIMENEAPKPSKINFTGIIYAPDTPEVYREGNLLKWKKVPGAEKYEVFANGSCIHTVRKECFQIPGQEGYYEYQVKSIGKNGWESFLSRPVTVNSNALIIIPADKFDAHFHESKSELVLSRKLNTKVNISVQIEREGYYLAGFVYANGSAPMWSSNTCAVRSLYLDEKIIGAIVFPVVGENQWHDREHSSFHKVFLWAGRHLFQLKFEPWNENMNGEINDFQLLQMLLEKL